MLHMHDFSLIQGINDFRSGVACLGRVHCLQMTSRFQTGPPPPPSSHFKLHQAEFIEYWTHRFLPINCVWL